ncbi:MAG: low molecular weight phosphotyrosine protein phosphatase [Phycisphaerales bacterium]|nr:low molecular weight phosphotyrosine protein phosphatase [Phycisphaerales bacterium]
MSQLRLRVLFVCMGNICRSPAAEAVFRQQIESRGLGVHFEADSAGTGAWHAGDGPDARMVTAASARGIRVEGVARQVHHRDLDAFDHIICMDSDNLVQVQSMGQGRAEVSLMLSHHPDDSTVEVPDPYYGGDEGFEHVVELLETACSHFIDMLIDRHALKS